MATTVDNPIPPLIPVTVAVNLTDVSDRTMAVEKQASDLETRMREVENMLLSIFSGNANQ